jgi:hypothetical protein
MPDGSSRVNEAVSFGSSILRAASQWRLLFQSLKDRESMQKTNLESATTSILEEDTLSKKMWTQKCQSATLLAVLNPFFFWGVQMEFSIPIEINSFHPAPHNPTVVIKNKHTA